MMMHYYYMLYKHMFYWQTSLVLKYYMLDVRSFDLKFYVCE